MSVACHESFLRLSLYISICLLGGSGDLVTRLIAPITLIVTLVILVINLLAKSP